MTTRSTTVIAVRRNGQTAMAGDGQVTIESTIVKSGATKIRTLQEGKVLVGFAGSAADGLTLFQRLEGKLQEFNGNLRRAAVELAKEWRTDRALRQLQALMIAADFETLLLISGTGDLVEPDEGIVAIGSGGDFARAAATALMRHTDLDAEGIAREALLIASSICVYTNDQVTVATLKQ